MGEFASRGLAGTALGFGIGGTALGVLGGGLSRVLNGVAAQPAQPAAAVAAQDATAAMLAAAAATAAGRGTCSEDHTVNRYEAQKDARIAELETEVKLRDANTYTDNKLLTMYQYIDGELKDIRKTQCEQAVWNATQTATIDCMGQQIAQLNGVLQRLTKVVIPNGSVCPGWGDVEVSVKQAGASAS